MGVPTYIFSQSLIPIWWKPIVMMGYSVQREEEMQQCGSGYIAHEVGIIRSGTAKAMITITELGSSCLFRSADSEPLNPDKSHMGVLWYSSRRDRQIARSVERILLSSGATAASNPMGCRLIYLCSRDFAEHWSEYFSRQGYMTTVLSSKVAESDVADIQVVSTNGSVECMRSSLDVFTGMGINPNTKQYCYYIALDYGRGLMNRWFHSNRKYCNVTEKLDALLQQQEATRISIKIKLHWK